MPTDGGDHPSIHRDETMTNVQNQSSSSLDAASNLTGRATSPESKSDSTEEASNTASSLMLFGVLIKKSNPEKICTTPTNATIPDQNNYNTSASTEGKQIEPINDDIQPNSKKIKFLIQPQAALACRFCTECVYCRLCKVVIEDSKGPQIIRKKLTKSDVDQSSRLLIGKQLKDNLLPFLTEAQRAMVCEAEGLPVQVRDVDNGDTYRMKLKQWKSRSYVLTSNWVKQFVERRNLKVNDTIELLWDRNASMFLFRVFEKWQGQASGSTPHGGGEEK